MMPFRIRKIIRNIKSASRRALSSLETGVELVGGLYEGFHDGEQDVELGREAQNVQAFLLVDIDQIKRHTANETLLRFRSANSLSWISRTFLSGRADYHRVAIKCIEKSSGKDRDPMEVN